MALVVAIRDFPAQVTLDDIRTHVAQGKGCLDAWNLTWLHSLRNPANNRMLCFFEGPDAESVRMSIRQDGWRGDVLVKSLSHFSVATAFPNTLSATIVVERHFETPVNFDDLQSKEAQHAWCLDNYQITFIESYFSLDRKTMLCLYHAPDAESVRHAQRQAEMPFNSVWTFQKLDATTFV